MGYSAIFEEWLLLCMCCVAAGVAISGRILEVGQWRVISTA
jgi:hypothetical protein